MLPPGVQTEVGTGGLVEAAAMIATVLAVVGTWPQLRRITAGEVEGVSMTSALLGLCTELAWVGYATSAEMWSAVPEAALMAAANALVGLGLWRIGVRAAVAPVVAWAAIIVGTGVIGGTAALAILLAVAYAVQLAPAVWCAFRTCRPSGIAAVTWALVLVEAVLWGCYGLSHGDPALTWFGVLGTAGAAAILLRKLSTRQASPALIRF